MFFSTLCFPLAVHSTKATDRTVLATSFIQADLGSSSESLVVDEPEHQTGSEHEYAKWMPANTVRQLLHTKNARGQWVPVNSGHQALIDKYEVLDPKTRPDQNGNCLGYRVSPADDHLKQYLSDDDKHAYAMVQQAKVDLNKNDYIHLKGKDVRKILKLYGATDADIEALKHFHEDLPLDPTKFYRNMSMMTYELDFDRGIIDRKRRHPFLLGNSDGYQGPAADLERWFGDWNDAKCRNTAHQAIVKFEADLIKAVPTEPRPGCDPNGYWLNSNFLARTTTGEGLQGEPASEGVHQDGTQYVLTMMMKKINWSGDNAPRTAVTNMDMPNQGVKWEEAHSAENKKHILFEDKHEDFLDMFMVKDASVQHVLSDLYQDDPSQPAFRGMLLSITRRNAAPDGILNPKTGEVEKHSFHTWDSQKQHETMPLTFEMRARKVITLDNLAKEQAERII